MKKALFLSLAIILVASFSPPTLTANDEVCKIESPEAFHIHVVDYCAPVTLDATVELYNLSPVFPEVCFVISGYDYADSPGDSPQGQCYDKLFPRHAEDYRYHLFSKWQSSDKSLSRYNKNLCGVRLRGHYNPGSGKVPSNSKVHKEALVSRY